MTDKFYERLEKAQDAVKTILQWAVVSVLGFAYWMAILLLISVFLLGYWHVQFESILKYGIVLAVITSIAYAVILVRRRLGLEGKRKKRKYKNTYR